jgi:quinoprotein glucose dehydrogenase
MGRVSGAWIYLAVFVATVIWAFWQVGTDGWALVPRVTPPLVLLVLALAALPALGDGRVRARTAWVRAPRRRWSRSSSAEAP